MNSDATQKQTLPSWRSHRYEPQNLRPPRAPRVAQPAAAARPAGVARRGSRPAGKPLRFITLTFVTFGPDSGHRSSIANILLTRFLGRKRSASRKEIAGLPEGTTVRMSVDPISPGSAARTLSPSDKPRTKSGRISFKNQLTKLYGSKFRDPYNDELLMGQKLPMGKAMGIMAVIMYGPNLPTEKVRHAERLLIWRSAAHYSLSPEIIKTVLEWEDEDERLVYMQGLLNTGTLCIRNVLYNSACSHGQMVFAGGRRDADVQRHLGLTMEQSVLDM